MKKELINKIAGLLMILGAGGFFVCSVVSLPFNPWFEVMVGLMILGGVIFIFNE